MRTPFALLSFALLSVSGHSATLHVPSQYPTIQAAIDAAAKGDTVLVAPGTYVELINFNGKAITVKSEQGAAVTVIDGNKNGTVVTCSSGEGPNSILDGFTITNGYGYKAGGGMNLYSSSPTVINCVFAANEAYADKMEVYGGGMNIFLGSPTVTRCVFLGNRAYGIAGVGGSMGGSGGGINAEDTTASVTGCIFSGNAAVFMPHGGTSGGGGIASYGFNSNVTVTDCLFVGNGASYGGGIGIDIGMLTNCTFVGNSCGYSGGGISTWGNITVTNTILWNNTAPNGPQIHVAMGAKLSADSSDVQGGVSQVYVELYATLNWGAGNIVADPLFVDEANGDYHLTYNSPCRNTGSNPAVTELYDFEGDPRIAQGTVDMGADEFHRHLYYTGDATPSGTVLLQLVGKPWDSPVALALGLSVLSSPLSVGIGDWYMAAPYIFLILPGSIPSSGVYPLPGALPATPTTPYTIYGQAIVNYKLTNLMEMNVK